MGSFSIIYRKKIISSWNFLQTFSIGCLCLRKKSPKIPQVEHHFFGQFPFSPGKTLRAKFFENFKLIFRQYHVYHSKALEKLYRRLLNGYSRFPYLTRGNSRRSCNLWSILDQNVAKSRTCALKKKYLQAPVFHICQSILTL